MVKINIRRYEAPVTHRVLVELEEGVCDASAPIQNPDAASNGKIDHQDVNNDFGYSYTTGWDQVENQ